MPLSDFIEQTHSLTTHKEGVLVITNAVPGTPLNIHVHAPVQLNGSENLSENAGVAVDVITGLVGEVIADADGDGTTNLNDGGVDATRARLDDIASNPMVADLVAGGRVDMVQALVPASFATATGPAVVIRTRGTIGTTETVVATAAIAGRTKFKEDASGNPIRVTDLAASGDDLEYPLVAGSIEVSTSLTTGGGISLFDLKGDGRLFGDRGTGTIDYQTGILTLEFASVPTADIDVDFEAIERANTGFGQTVNVSVKYVGDLSY